MKRGKDEGKIMGPMFPRLHVNDTDKGGPRAPPRNKMALYEQLSIPSQRFSHTVLPNIRNGITPNSVPHLCQVMNFSFFVFFLMKFGGFMLFCMFSLCLRFYVLLLEYRVTTIRLGFLFFLCYV